MYKLIFYPFIILDVVFLLAEYLLYYIFGIVDIFGNPIFNSHTFLALISILFFIYPFLINITFYTTSTDKALLDKDNNKDDKEVNDINSNSFSIYAIDTDEKKIYVTYFGAHKGASIESISYK